MSTSEGGQMNKAELIDKIAGDTNITKADCERVLNNAIDHIRKAVKRNEDVTLVGFGTFTKAKRKARLGRNPQTGASIKIPATVVPKFRAGKEFKNFITK